MNGLPTFSGRYATHAAYCGVDRHARTMCLHILNSQI
jgi:hypothetical protein